MPPERLDNVETACARCGSHSFMKEHSVTVAPDVLMICLNRWTDAAQPQLHCVEPAHTLEFADNTYALRSVVSHLGVSQHKGHYVAVTRHDTTGGAWWMYNDALRRLAREDEISPRAVVAGYGQMKSYVLLYER